MRSGRNHRWLLLGVVLPGVLIWTVVVLAFPAEQNTVAMNRITVASDPERDSRSVSLSADGRWVAFHSDSDLLGQGIPDNQFEIWLYDTLTLTYTRVTAVVEGDRDSFSPRLSADGTRLIFYSDADFLSEGIVDNQNEVWLYDVVTKSYARLTMASDGDRESRSESLSADGTRVAFTSDSDLLGEGIIDEQVEVWLYDAQTMTYTRVTTASDPERQSYSPRMNAEGTLLVFSSDSDFLGQGIEDDQFEIWLYDVTDGVLTRITHAPDNSRSSFAPTLSADGTLLTFVSDVDILNQGIPSGQYEVWLYSITGGDFTRVTTATDGGRASDSPVLNADGATLVFHSDSDFLGDGDSVDGYYELWSYDVASGGLARITVRPDLYSRSLQPSLTALGDRVAFESSADFLGQGIATEQYEIWLFSLSESGPTLIKTVDEPAPWPYLPITYTLRVVNPLDVDFSEGIISDTLPSGLTFTGPVTLDPPQPGAVLAGDVGDLPVLAAHLVVPARSTITVTFSALVNGDVAWGTLLTNTASFTSPHLLAPIFGTVAVDVRYRVVAVAPDPYSHVVPSDTSLFFLTNDTLDINTMVLDFFFVHGGFRGRLDGVVKFGGDYPAGAIFEPAANLRPGERIQVTVPAGARNLDGLAISPYVWTFRTATLGGTGAFVAHPVTPTLPTFQSIGVALGDLDGDDDLDVVLANADGAPETVWLNDGNGGLYPRPAHPSFGDGDSWDVALGDLDHDGDLDAVVANVVTDTVWLNDGLGRFLPHPTMPHLGTEISRRVALGDLDGDGDLDAVFTHFNHADTVWVNTGAGHFVPHATTPAFGVGSSFDVALGDLDNDGDLDALVTKVSLPDVVWFNDGLGNFTFHAMFGSGTSYGLDLGDVDGDGDLDAVIARSRGLPETVWVNDGTGRFYPHATTPYFGAGDSQDVTLGDLDGDGDLDAIVANTNGQSQTVWLNDGAGNFVPQPDVPDFGHGDSLRVVSGDLDGDGALDVVIGDSASGDVSIWRNRIVYKVMLPLILRGVTVSH